MARRTTNHNPTIKPDWTRSTTLSQPNSRALVFQPGSNLMSPYYRDYPRVLGSGVSMGLASDGLKKNRRGKRWSGH
jgi:hypothetical protein